MKKHLSDLFFAHAAKRVDKWEQYLGMYQSELAQFAERETSVRLLEIGVQNGGSLELWSKYLPRGSVIRGLDINEKVSELTFEDGDIAVFVGDATDSQRVDKLFGNDCFDIIIDDGSHYSSHVIATLGLFFPLLKPGGKYIVEDLHCSYHPGYEGGYRERHSSVEWLKQLIDVLNADHIVRSDSFSEDERNLIAAFGASLARVAFYDSVAVIEKLSVEKKRPYRRVLAGRQAHVLKDEQWLSLEPIRNFEPMLSGQLAARHLETALIARLDAAQHRAVSLEADVADAVRELAEARQQAAEATRAASVSLARQEAEHRRRLDAALAEQEAAHQEALQAALSAREAAHENQLRAALEARESAYRDELGLALSWARKARISLRNNAKHFSANLSRRLHIAALAGPRRRLREKALCRPLLDSAWYLQRYPDVAAAGIDPLEHFLAIGASEMRDPNPLFDTSWYLEQNPDVAAIRMNPLVHYIVFGAIEGRNPNELFDTCWYLERNADVAAAGINPLAHYLVSGAAEGRDPSERFDTDWYLRQNPGAAGTGMNPLAHYLRFGRFAGSQPRGQGSAGIETNPPQTFKMDR